MRFEVDVDELEVVGEVPSLLIEGECEFDASRLAMSAEPGKVGRKPDKRAAAAEWVTQYLAQNGASKAGDVIEDAKQFGLANKTVRRAADDMGVVRTPPGGGRNCTWDLPNDLKALLGVAITDTTDEDPDRDADQKPTLDVVGPDGEARNPEETGNIDEELAALLDEEAAKKAAKQEATNPKPKAKPRAKPKAKGKKKGQANG
jgi:hypothetical protein